jgi:hypothetical protein
MPPVFADPRGRPAGWPPETRAATSTRDKAQETPMTEIVVIAAVAALVLLIMLTEVAAAVLPILIVIVLVPPEQRDDLARVVAACDSSRRLRAWRALRLAVEARRRERTGLFR